MTKISIGNVTVAEPLGSDPALAVFEVTLDAPSDTMVAVDWTTAPLGVGEAQEYMRYVMLNGEKVPAPYTSIIGQMVAFYTDYFGDFGTLTFAPGETKQTIAVQVLAGGMDITEQAEERFSVVLSNAAGATIEAGTGMGTILDTTWHTPPEVGVVPSSANEPYFGLVNPTALSFTVNLSHAYVDPVTVAFATQDGTAKAGEDYTATTGTLTFAPGETEKVVSVPLLGDDEVDADETMALVLSSPTGATLGTASKADGTIADTPVPPAEPGDPHFSMIVNRALSYPLATAFVGPVTGMDYALVTGAADETVRATDLADFVNTKGGNDAVNGGGGGDILDGGTGSNFLTGGSGLDTFFVDARERDVAIWSTVTDLDHGEGVTFWGLNEADFTLDWADAWGTPGFTGLTLVAQDKTGGQPAALTLTGYSQADKDAGRLLVMFGNEPVSGSDYLYVYAV